MDSIDHSEKKTTFPANEVYHFHWLNAANTTMSKIAIMMMSRPLLLFAGSPVNIYTQNERCAKSAEAAALSRRSAVSPSGEWKCIVSSRISYVFKIMNEWMLEKLGKRSQIDTPIWINTESWSLPEGHPLPMPTMFGRGPWTRSWVSYPAHRLADRQTDKQTNWLTNKQHRSHNSTVFLFCADQYSH